METGQRPMRFRPLISRTAKHVRFLLPWNFLDRSLPYTLQRREPPIMWRRTRRRSLSTGIFRQVGMRRINFPLLVLGSVLLLRVATARAADKPRYGGTLRVEVHAASLSFDPREWKVGSLESATNEKLAALVLERLLALDNYGRFQPLLAIEWPHNASYKRWQFAIRPGVKFSDDSVLTAADVVAALQPLLPGTQQISATGNAVVIQSAAPVPDLLEQLASGRYFVYRVLPGGTLAGTGPFVLGEAPIGAVQSGHLFFHMNDEAWSGRPFV